MAVAVLRSCVKDKALGGLMSSSLELRLERFGPLATNVNVGMVELAPLRFKQLKEKAYDLQLLFW